MPDTTFLDGQCHVSDHIIVAYLQHSGGSEVQKHSKGGLNCLEGKQTPSPKLDIREKVDNRERE